MILWCLKSKHYMIVKTLPICSNVTFPFSHSLSSRAGDYLNFPRHAILLVPLSVVFSTQNAVLYSETHSLLLGMISYSHSQRPKFKMPSANLQLLYTRNWQIFPVKGQVVNILGLGWQGAREGIRSVWVLTLPWWHKSSIKEWMWQCRGSSWIWPKGWSLPTPALVKMTIYHIAPYLVVSYI